MQNATAGIALTLTLGLFGGCAPLGGYPPLDVVDTVDLDRYAGKWYEIARYPNWFQDDNCDATTAEYTVRDDGTVRVENRCTNLDTGGEDVIVGSARVPDLNAPGKLAVSFFGPFEAPYWILALDEEYEWAVVGGPSRAFFWILSRTPEMAPADFAWILEQMPAWGYDPERLRITEHPALDG